MKTAQVVVIDEDAEEALALLTALGKAGIGAVYVKGDDPKCIPESPCEGIRLVFLDLKMIAADEAKDYLPFAAKILKESVKVDPGVTGVICWTKHEEEVELLRSQLEEQGIKPAFLASLPNKMDLANDGDVEGILGEIKKIVEPMHGRALLTSWEEAAHVSTSNAANAMWQLGGDDGNFIRVLAAIAKAAADQGIDSAQAASAALRTGLAAVHADGLEQATFQVSGSDAEEKLFSAVKKLREENLELEQRAQLNRVLVTAAPSKCSPGCVYLAEKWDPEADSPTEFSEKAIRGLVGDFFPTISRKRDIVQEIASGSKMCLVELTPPCDFAQNKSPFSRLVAGLLIKSNSPLFQEGTSLPAESRIFAKETPFFQIQNPEFGIDGCFKIVLNARQLVTVPRKKLEKQRPVTRLRHQLIADFTSWFAAHAARPGFVAVY